MRMIICILIDLDEKKVNVFKDVFNRDVIYWMNILFI